jgi:signal transduction histidine kinase/phage shock protein PspC (stress-responsive transcriptional regulator)
VSSAATILTPPEVRRMYRPQSGRVLVGVCAGLATHLRVPLAWTRGGFVMATLFGGIGVPVYLLLWVFTPAGYLVDPRTGEVQGADGGSLGERLGRVDPAWRVLIAGAGMLAIGGPLLAGMFGTDLPLTSVLAILAVVGGAVIAWSHLDTEERRHWLGVPSRGRDRSSLARIIAGAALAVSGSIVLATRGSGPTILWDVLIATVAVLCGLGLVLAPWGIRFWKRLQAEQASRIRETERADIAAHLHDSVLQTLALIQRTDDPARIAQLARAQERELRTWLYGGGKAATDSLATAATDVAAEVEELHGVPIDLVVTGDRPLDEGAEALVRALREALLNAVRHGAPPVTAYVEAGRDRVEAFVRDRGAGFDLDDIPEDRLGVRESILGRMERHGGTAKIRRLEGGTEVELCLPVAAPEAPEPAEPSARPEPKATPEAPAPTSHPEPKDADEPAEPSEPAVAPEAPERVSTEPVRSP